MKIQIFSDLHLEFYKTFPQIKPLCDYLFLAGDIGKMQCENFKMFLQYVSSNWKKVFYVLGNHEFYNKRKTHSKLIYEYKLICAKYDNVYLLDRDIIELEDYIVMGCTMWTSVDYTVSTTLNDFNQIMMYKYTDYGKRKACIDIEYRDMLHECDKTWILENYDPYKKTILLTHFPVTQHLTSHEKYVGITKSELDAYCNEIELKTHTYLSCIAGHTHYGYLNKTPFENVWHIANPSGYPGEVVENFDEMKLYVV
jgi:predicted MPP superfamily phosphohydrolase